MVSLEKKKKNTVNPAKMTYFKRFFFVVSLFSFTKSVNKLSLRYIAYS